MIYRELQAPQLSAPPLLSKAYGATTAAAVAVLTELNLARCFWLDLEQYHPGISSLHLPRDVASAWKGRLQTKSKTTTLVPVRRSRSRSNDSATSTRWRAFEPSTWTWPNGRSKIPVVGARG
jgi:hypothetical protein